MATKSSRKRTANGIDAYDDYILGDKDIIRKILNKKLNIKAKNKTQKDAINLIKSKELVFVAGVAGTGKTYIALATALDLLADPATPYNKIYLVKSVTSIPNEELGFIKGPQPLYEKVLTPNGWKTMGEINKNDFVIGSDGKPKKVLETYETGKKDIYRIILQDGRFADSSLDHIWRIKTKNLDYFNVNTEFILNSFKKENLFLPPSKPIFFEKNELELNPYILGVLLGDGCLTGTHVRFCSIDTDLIEKVEKIVKNNYDLNLTKNNIIYTITSTRKGTQRGAKEIIIRNIKTNEIVTGYLKDICEKLKVKDTTIIGRCINNLTIDGFEYGYTGKKSKSSNPIKEILIDLDLLGKSAYNKFIPKKYLYSSYEDRVELLRGLLDTDGTIKKNGEIVYFTTSPELAENIKELALSLGASARLYLREKFNEDMILNGQKIIQRKPIYTIYIKFISEYFNPFFIKRKAERFKKLFPDYLKIKNVIKINENIETKCIKIDSQDSLYVTKDYIITHNTIEDKIQPVMWSYMMNVNKLISEGAIMNLLEQNYIKFLPLAYIRGLSIDNAIIILDETQNITIDTLRTILTRIGENSKFIALGDTRQVDLKQKSKSALETALRLFENVDEIGVMEFSSDDIVRNPIIKIIEDKFEEYEQKNSTAPNNRRVL